MLNSYPPTCPPKKSAFSLDRLLILFEPQSMEADMRYVVLFVLVAVLSGGSGEPSFSRKGYFKSDAKDRIFTFMLPEGVVEQEVQKFAKGRAHTAGQMTAIYFYELSAMMVPADGITFAVSVFAANDVLDDPQMSRWRYVYMHYRNGIETFVDCTSSVHELCKP